MPRLGGVALFVALVGLLVGCAPAQPARDPGAITAAGALGSPLLLANGASTVYARIRIATVAQPERRPRGPVNVALAMDTSGSMEGAAIVEARKAALQVIDALHDGDRLAVVAFHTKTEVLLASTELTPDVREDIKKRIAAMKAEGTTDMSGGLGAAIEEVRAHFVDKGINRVVLLGDGIPNQASGIESLAARAAEGGIAITTLGLGLDYDETLMGKIAQSTGGRFKYVASADKVAGFFHEELQRIDTVYGRHARVALSAGPGVRIDSVVGSPSAAQGSGAYLTLGDLAAGDTRDVIVKLTVTPRKAGVPIELVDASITFDDALEEAGKLERHVYLGAHTVEGEDEVAKARNPEIELAAALAEASAATLAALELSKQGSYVRARELLTSGSQAATEQEKRTPSSELKKHAEDMAAVAKDLPVADKPVPRSSYQFHDDGMQAAPAEMSIPNPAPEVMQKRKEVHQQAIDAFQ